MDPSNADDWNLVEKQRLEAERLAMIQATEDLRASVAMLDDLGKSEAWKHLQEMLNNMATIKRAEAMKATDPTTMARSLGYMSAMLDAVGLPLARSQQLRDELDRLQKASL